MGDWKAILRGLRNGDDLAINAAIDYAQEQDWPDDHVQTLYNSLTGKEEDQLSPDMLAFVFETFVATNWPKRTS